MPFEFFWRRDGVAGHGGNSVGSMGCCNKRTTLGLVSTSRVSGWKVLQVAEKFAIERISAAAAARSTRLRLKSPSSTEFSSPSHKTAAIRDREQLPSSTGIHQPGALGFGRAGRRAGDGRPGRRLSDIRRLFAQLENRNIRALRNLHDERLVAAFPSGFQALSKLARLYPDNVVLVEIVVGCAPEDASSDRLLTNGVENALLGRLDTIREQPIGTRVFGRAPDYNLNEDNIVRVEARELRKRLETYFAGEGRNEPLIVEVPKGGYVPVFKLREQPPDVAEPAARTPVAAVLPAEPKPRAPGWWMPVLLGSLAVLIAAVLWLGLENWRLLQRFEPQASARSAAAAEDYSFYGELLGKLGATPNRETLLVLSNPKVVLYYGSPSNQPIPTMPGHTIPAPKELKARSMTP